MLPSYHHVLIFHPVLSIRFPRQTLKRNKLIIIPDLYNGAMSPQVHRVDLISPGPQVLFDEVCPKKMDVGNKEHNTQNDKRDSLE